MKPFIDIFDQGGEKPVFCYRSGLMVYEEQLVAGTLISCGWNAAGYPLNVLSNCPTRLREREFTEPSAFGLEIDGVCLDYDWSFVGFEKRETETGLEGVLTLESKIKPVRVKVHTLLDGTQVLSRFLEVENLSDSHLCVSRLRLLSGGVESMDRNDLDNGDEYAENYEIGYFDSEIWGHEGEFAWHPLQRDRTAVDMRFGRSRYRHPAIWIRNRVKGTILSVQMAWSGGCRFTLDYDAAEYKPDARLWMSAEVTGYSPLLVLRPREVFMMPEVEAGIISGGLDEAVNDMNAHVRRSVLNMPEVDTSACLVGAGMGAEHDMSMETTKAFIRQMAEMGSEVFIIDAGWACPPAKEMQWPEYNGLNVPDPERYPNNGLAELRDYCHSLGVKFSLWVEIERLGERAPEFAAHPEWRALDVFGNQARGYIDLTVPEAAAWAESELARLIGELGMDMLRVDYNVDSASYFFMRDTDGSGIRECIALRQFAAVYKMYRNLKKRFPNVAFENCAGGGGRTDLGHNKAFNHTWVSDWQKPPRSALITNGMTMALPPEHVDRLFAGMGCHTAGSLDFHMRNVMLGHMSLNVISPAAAAWNEQAMEFVRHSVQLYKDFIRPFLPQAKVFHHTPEARRCMEDGFCAMEIASPDGSRGALAAFTLIRSAKEERVVYPRGVDASRTYRVTLDNTGVSWTATGAELRQTGLRLRIPAALSSELVLYEAVEG